VEEESDTSHASEDVAYLAVEVGDADTDYTGGVAMESGWAIVDADLGSSELWEEHSFTIPFSAPPAMVSSSMDHDGGDNCKTRLKDVGTTAFNVTLDETPAFTGVHASEDVGWLAVSNDSVIYGRKYITGQAPSVSNGTEEQVSNFIRNSGNYNMSGYLLMQVKNSTGSVISTRVNGSATGTKSNAASGTGIDAAGAWNATPWNTSSYPTGYYTAVASLTDPYGNVLENSSGADITGSYTFYIDRDSPVWSSLGANDTTPAPLNAVAFYSMWQDNGDLSGWRFQWNVSGSMTDNATGTFSSTPGWSNVTRTIPPSMELKTVAYRFVVNDTTGLSNTTDTKYLNVRDVTGPVVTGGAASPQLVNVNRTVNLSASVTDNSGSPACVWARVGIPGDGWTNASMPLAAGSTYRVSYMPTQRGTYNATVYANDTSGNGGGGSVF
jgi:hypothetical protein